MDGTANESMTTIFLAENTGTNGLVVDEEEFVDATATLFLGQSIYCHLNPLVIPLNSHPRWSGYGTL